MTRKTSFAESVGASDAEVQAARAENERLKAELEQSRKSFDDTMKLQSGRTPPAPRK